MIFQRTKGIVTFILILVMLLNVAFFYLWWVSVKAFKLIDLTERAQDYGLIYEMAVIISCAFCIQKVVQKQNRIAYLHFAESLGIALRMAFGFSFGVFLIYFALKDSGINRSFLFFYGALYVPFNTIIWSTLPRIVMGTFYPDSTRSNTVLIGDQRLPTGFKSFVEQDKHLGLRFVGYYADEAIEDLSLEWLGTKENFIQEETGKHKIQRVLTYNIEYNDEFFKSLFKHCHDKGIRIQAFLKLINEFEDPVHVVNYGDLNFISFINDPLDNPINRIIKRLLDLAIAIPVVMFVLPPLFLVIWVLQLLQAPGPVIFRQKRYGHDRDTFHIYKFRTMYNTAKTADEEAQQAIKEDTRIYPLGRFLRKSSIDEFPQFINVLRGQMSLVGPRPLPIKLDDEWEQYCIYYRSRHFVKPGITGYAQVNGMRGEIQSTEELKERHRMDLHYINYWSMGLDVFIISQTALHMINPPKSAY